MKKSELIEIIRIAVRAELTECLPKIVTESVNKCLKSTHTVDPVELTKKVLDNTPKKKVRTPKKTPTTQPQVQFTRNTALNEALNATVGGVPQEGSMVSGLESKSDQITDFQGQAVDVEELPDHISNALTRDYSELLNLVDKKKGGS
jgi:hypothetical protein